MRALGYAIARSCFTIALAGCGASSPLPPATSQPAPDTDIKPGASSIAPPASGVPYAIRVELLPNRSPLTDVISEQQTDRLKALLDGGADPNLREGDDATSWPALASAMKGRGFSVVDERDARIQLEMTTLLLEHGADPNGRRCNDEDRPRCDARTGVTPLMYAGILGDESLSALLLRHGADPALRDWRGLVAADYWGVKNSAASLCASPRANEPLLDDARVVADGKFGEPYNADMLQALGAPRMPYSAIAVVKDPRVCEAAAFAYARHRLLDDHTQTAPRSVVPVLVIRVGGVMLVDDLRDRGDVSETGLFDRSWHLVGWGMTGS
jgi:hypothetical protein